MYYIRFLKRPAYLPLDGGRGRIKLLVTIVNDLGDCYYDQNIFLKSFLLTADEVIVSSSQKSLRWVEGTRQLWITLGSPAVRSSMAWRLVVAAASTEDPWQADRISLESGDAVLTAMSAPFDPLCQPKATSSVLRRVALGQGSRLDIEEDTADSIARHIW